MTITSSMNDGWRIPKHSAHSKDASSAATLIESFPPSPADWRAHTEHNGSGAADVIWILQIKNKYKWIITITIKINLNLVFDGSG